MSSVNLSDWSYLALALERQAVALTADRVRPGLNVEGLAVELLRSTSSSLRQHLAPISNHISLGVAKFRVDFSMGRKSRLTDPPRHPAPILDTKPCAHNKLFR
jgi:hypothetical protein